MPRHRVPLPPKTPARPPHRQPAARTPEPPSAAPPVTATVTARPTAPTSTPARSVEGLAAELEALASEATRLTRSAHPRARSIGRSVLMLWERALETECTREEATRAGDRSALESAATPTKKPTSRAKPAHDERAQAGATAAAAPPGAVDAADDDEPPRAPNRLRSRAPNHASVWLRNLDRWILATQASPVPVTDRHGRASWAEAFGTLLRSGMPWLSDTRAPLVDYFATASLEGRPPREVLREVLTLLAVPENVIAAAVLG